MVRNTAIIILTSDSHLTDTYPTKPMVKAFATDWAAAIITMPTVFTMMLTQKNERFMEKSRKTRNERKISDGGDKEGSRFTIEAPRFQIVPSPSWSLKISGITPFRDVIQYHNICH